MLQRGSHHRGNSSPVYQPIRKMGSGTAPRFCLTQQGTDRGTEIETEPPAWTVSGRSKGLAVAPCSRVRPPQLASPTAGLPCHPIRIKSSMLRAKRDPRASHRLMGKVLGTPRITNPRPIAWIAKSIACRAATGSSIGVSSIGIGQGRANRALKMPRNREAADDV